MKKIVGLMLILVLCVSAFLGTALATAESDDVTDFDFFDSPTLVSWIEVLKCR